MAQKTCTVLIFTKITKKEKKFFFIVRMKITGLPLINLNEYWPAIGNLVCVLVICIVWRNFFYRHYKQIFK